MNLENVNTQNLQDLKKEKNNFLAAYHILKFTKDDKDSFEIADIERRLLAMKYMAVKLFDSEDAAAIQLQKSLKDYHILLRNKDGVNNYWKQIKSQVSDVKNDPTKWRSGLTDTDVTINFVKCLACQKSNALYCKKKYYNDRDIEKVINISKTDKHIPERHRKISLSNKLPLKHNEQNESVFPTSIPRSNNLNKPVDNMKQNVFKLKSGAHIQPSCPNLNKLELKVPSQSANNNTNEATRKLCITSNPYAPKLKSVIPSQTNKKAQENITGGFKTAKDELYIQQMKNNTVQKKTLGGRGAVNAQFISPFAESKEKSVHNHNTHGQNNVHGEKIEDERLKNIDPNMIELIKNEIMDSGKSITWDDIAGLEYTKKIILEVVVFPMLRPDIFTGLRRPPKGILLFGPPGTGKTLIGKCIASQSKSTFFSISASSLTSKWVGEGEKMVRALFAVAKVHQPSVIFIDEIDSLLTQRSETEHESSRRLKTEFLVQLDGAATSEEDRILIVGATNRPQELDEAARRRLVKRLYVPLPEFEARKQIICNLLASVRHNLQQEEIIQIAEKSAGYSGADMTNLCKEASMEPIRSIPFNQLENIKMEEVRHITCKDFEEALINVRPSVSQSDLAIYIDWDRTYGSGTAQSYKT